MGRSAIPLGRAGKHVSAQLAKVRRQARLTQSQVTEMVNAETGHQLPRQALTEIETRRRRVDVDDLVSLAQVLGTDPHTLLGWPQEETL